MADKPERRRGRPSVQPESALRSSLSVRLTHAQFDRLAQQASKERIKPPAWVRQVLEERLGRD
jgi:hypothetical protein